MKWITHKRMRLIPMSVVDVDVDYVLDYLFDTSEGINEKKIDKGDVIRRDEDICRLDPGGMLNMKEEWIQFYIDGSSFEIQLTKVSWVLAKLKRAKERIPSCRRIGLFHYNVICSTRMCLLLIEKLKELDKTDAALHAEIDDAEIKAKLEAKGHMFFPDIPKEPGRNKDEH